MNRNKKTKNVKQNQAINNIVGVNNFDILNEEENNTSSKDIKSKK